MIPSLRGMKTLTFTSRGPSAVAGAYRHIVLPMLDDDPDREGLKKTPERVVKAWQEFLHPDEFEMTTFDAEGASEMIVQTGIWFYSFCEHHLLPFFGTVDIAYIPNGRLVGLSKIARTVDKFSRRLQNQERMTNQIGDFLCEALSPLGVGVMVDARHLCMEMRGIQKPGVSTKTSALRGLFLEQDRVRSEFLALSSTS